MAQPDPLSQLVGEELRKAREQQNQPVIIPASPKEQTQQKVDEARIGQIGAGTKKTEVETAGLEAKQGQEEKQRVESEALRKFRDDELGNIVLPALDKAKKLVGLTTTGWGHTLLGAIPTTEARELASLFSEDGVVGVNTLLKGMEELKLANPPGSSGTGFGQLAIREGDALRNRLGSLDLSLDRAAVAKNIDSIDQSYKRFILFKNGIDANDPEVQKRYGLKPTAVQEFLNYQDPKVVATGDKVQVQPPKALQYEFTTELLKIPRGQLTREKLDQITGELYPKYGFGANMENADAFVKSYNDLNQKPSLLIPPAETDASTYQKMITEGASNPWGTAFATGVNALGGGIGQMIMGERANEAYDALRRQNPTASVVGDIAGSVAGVSVLENLGLKSLMKGGVKRSLAADMGYSGVREFAEHPERDIKERIAGALGDAGEAAVANLGMRGITRGLRDLAPSVTKYGEEISDRDLIDQYKREGVKVTPMQDIGVPGAEDVISSFPGVHGAGEEALGTWYKNKFLKNGLDVIDRSLPADVPPGRAALNKYYEIVQEEFNKLNPVTLGRVKGKDSWEINKILDPRNYNTDVERKLVEQLQAVVGPAFRKPGEFFNGDELRKATSELGTLARDWASSTDMKDANLLRKMGGVAADIRDRLINMIEQPELKKKFGNLSEAYQRQIIMEDAMSRAGVHAGGVPTPEQLLASIRRFDTSARKSRLARGDAKFQDELEEATRVMGASPPKSVSPWAARIALIMSSIGAGGVGAGYGAATAPEGDRAPGASWGFAKGILPALAVASAYSPGSRRIVQAMIAGKRPVLNEIPPATLSQALQAYVTRRKDEEGLQ